MKLLLLGCLVLVTLTHVSHVSATDTCPPCPAPPVHACCSPSAQVGGTCCQVR